MPGNKETNVACCTHRAHSLLNLNCDPDSNPNPKPSTKPNPNSLESRQLREEMLEQTQPAVSEGGGVLWRGSAFCGTTGTTYTGAVATWQRCSSDAMLKKGGPHMGSTTRATHGEHYKL